MLQEQDPAKRETLIIENCVLKRLWGVRLTVICLSQKFASTDAYYVALI
jgi:hypothetical protein